MNFYCGIPSPSVRPNFHLCEEEEEQRASPQPLRRSSHKRRRRLAKYSGQCNHSNVLANGHNRLKRHTDVNSLFINSRILCPSVTMNYIDKCPHCRLSLVTK